MTTAIIGGSAFGNLGQFEVQDSLQINTPFGKTSGAILKGKLNGEPCIFLARHGDQHSIPPHKINYRANIYALKELQAERIIALAAVGGINEPYQPGSICLPDQIIDYTYGREITFFEGRCKESPNGEVVHTEFTEPYSFNMRKVAIDVTKKMEIPLIDKGVYAVTQGPRFETAAEIKRLQKDGADIVGMTGMPECALAREQQIPYLTIASSVNYAAGISETIITWDEIAKAIEISSKQVYSFLPALLKAFEGLENDTPQLLKL